MIENRRIRIYDFSIAEDKEVWISKLNSLMNIGNLVPVIGAGFTKELRTHNGVVPSVDELKREMVSIMSSIEKSDESEFKEIPLPNLADELWDYLDAEENYKYKERFRDYIDINFTKVFDIDQSRRHFLNSRWKTIFTLNYDDAIENTLDIDVVVPYDKYSVRNDKNSVIKLHGDAKRYVTTGDSKYCVLGKRQYVNLIKSSDNKDILNVMESAFFSKSILFIGCSLDDELDILYSAGTQLEVKAKRNDQHHIIYVLFDEQKDINTIKFKEYGITDIIKVDDNSIIELYESIHLISKENEVLRKKDLLGEFTDIRLEYLDERNDKNLDYLFYNDRVDINNGVIKYPGFFIERHCGEEITKNILENKYTLNIVSGTNFSGKTYVLLQILKAIENNKVYYFPSSIELGDNVIMSLPERKNVIYLIDDKVIDFEQYRDRIIPLLDVFKENNIKLVLAVNKSDMDFYKYYKDNKDIPNKNVKFYELQNKFNEKERCLFNNKIGNISLAPYKENDTILDYLFRVDDNTLKNKRKSILPKVNFLRNECEKEVRALIILATKGAISSQVSVDLGIDDVLYDLATEFSISIQKDYLSELEKVENKHSGFKFILNSNYWAVKCLAGFANNTYNHKTIVKSYCNIINTYSNSENLQVRNRLKEYYMLDKIQLLFSNHDTKGTVRLPYLIYEGLHSTLNYNFQFLHQEAKCELRMAKREKTCEKVREILELSYRNIVRALGLAEEVNSYKIEYTIAHMKVTKALILINYILTGEIEQFYDTVDACYDAFVIGESLCPQLEKEELKDVKSFIENNWGEKLNERKDIENKFNELYTRYMRRPSWRIG
ncbi:SIR2 family protein [Lacrimispora sp.]|uniref:SIR2 family protein n=1 Tax=Lacrimispora sp. TaxID=2719234 RepID=UPI00399634B8